MAAPKAGTFTARTGPLAGLTFTGTPGTSQAYNRYQQARAHALGFSSYSHQRQVQRGSVFKGLLSGLTQGGTVKPTPAQREDILKALGERQKVEQVNVKGRLRNRYKLDVDFTDHSRGGSYDMYLRRIGRRTGNEDWNPGETP